MNINEYPVKHMGEYYMGIIFKIVASGNTTIKDLCRIMGRDETIINLLLSILNSRMDIAYSNLAHHMNICLLANGVVRLALYPSTLLNKYIRITNILRIEEIYKNITCQYYIANKLLDSDDRPINYYSNITNINKKDSFVDDPLELDWNNEL